MSEAKGALELKLKEETAALRAAAEDKLIQAEARIAELRREPRRSED
jgi:hypothetical protein